MHGYKWPINCTRTRTGDAHTDWRHAATGQGGIGERRIGIDCDSSSWQAREGRTRRRRSGDVGFEYAKGETHPTPQPHWRGIVEAREEASRAAGEDGARLGQAGGYLRAHGAAQHLPVRTGAAIALPRRQGAFEDNPQ